MVSLTINFYQIREEIKKELINRLENIEISEYPLDSAWLLYALVCESNICDPFLGRGIYELEKWALSLTTATKDKELAPLSLCGYLSKSKEVRENCIKKILPIIRKNLSISVLPKFNVFNDPEQVFCLSLLSDKLPEDIRERLTNLIEKNLKGGIVRIVLFMAALFELKKEGKFLEKPICPKSGEEIILALWLKERYKSHIKEDVLSFWRRFEGIYPAIELTSTSGGSYLSNRNLAFLYESVLNETQRPDPNIIFDFYPLHPEIRRIAENYFKTGKYVNAVFEVTKKLNEMIQERTGIKNKSENALVQATMKSGISNPKNLVIQFNGFLDKVSGENEQSGLALITEGIFKAFRNPKGHEPEDHPLVELDPYEALNQLITIDYIWKRIESAKIKKKES